MNHTRIPYRERELLCPKCDYDLRGNWGGDDHAPIICPECGERTTAASIGEEPKPLSATWILMPSLIFSGSMFLAALGFYPALALVMLVLLVTPPYLLWCGYRAIAVAERRRHPVFPFFQAVAYLLANLLIAFLLTVAAVAVASGFWLF